MLTRTRADGVKIHLISQLFDLIPMHSDSGMLVTSAPMSRRIRRFVPHAGLKHAAASELSPMPPDLSPGHGGNSSSIQELNKRLTDMKMASNQDTVLRRESTFSNYWSMKSEYSRKNSLVRNSCGSCIVRNLLTFPLVPITFYRRYPNIIG